MQQENTKVKYPRIYLKILKLVSAGLTDSAMVELSQRTTCESELIDLGVNVLNLPEHKIQSALYDKKEIQSAAYKLLTSWLQQQTNRHDAYNTLHSALKKADHNMLAAYLQQWVSGPLVQSQLSTERKYVKIPKNFNCIHIRV